MSCRCLFLPSQELEENVVYEEKEDEFDVVVDSGDPEGHKRKAEKEQEEEEAMVSIEAIDTVSLSVCQYSHFAFFMSHLILKLLFSIFSVCFD